MSSKIFSSALSKNTRWQDAVQEAVKKIRKDMGDVVPDLAIVFVSQTYTDFDSAEFTSFLEHQLPAKHTIGCNASGVVGGREEVEMEPAVSVMAMSLPGVKIEPFVLTPDQVHGFESGAQLIAAIDVYPTATPNFICLADPASTDVTRFLTIVNDAYKGMPVIGGLASGLVLGIENWLCLDGQVFSEGLVGVALTGDIRFETLVSQGCRPIGKPFVITNAEGVTLNELAGKPALQAVQETFDSLTAKDKKLAEQSILVGIVMNERQSTFKRGDFLIRNLMGYDTSTGALKIGASLRVGQTLQFQVRDAETSEEDLKHLLEKISAPLKSDKTRGALLVSCCGRGKGLYGKADHDVSMIQDSIGPIAITGFFANGEIGPIQQRNFIHGFTSSLVIVS